MGSLPGNDGRLSGPGGCGEELRDFGGQQGFSEVAEVDAGEASGAVRVGGVRKLVELGPSQNFFCINRPQVYELFADAGQMVTEFADVHSVDVLYRGEEGVFVALNPVVLNGLDLVLGKAGEVGAELIADIGNVAVPEGTFVGIEGYGVEREECFEDEAVGVQGFVGHD